jgi:hypothetical protein
MMSASVSAIGALMVTGVTSSKTAIKARSPVLTAKTRQKNGKARISTPRR